MCELCKYTLTLLTLHIVFYYFFTNSKTERRKLILVIVCEKQEIIIKKKEKKNWYFNLMKCKIDNLMYGILRRKYVK